MRATGARYRETSRKRGLNWRIRERAAGKKHLNILIPGEIHARLMDERERTGDNLAEIATRHFQNSFEREGRGKNSVKRNAEIPPPPPRDPEKHDRLRLMTELREAGYTSAQIAAEMERRGWSTPSGRGRWSKHTVDNLFQRAKT